MAFSKRNPNQSNPFGRKLSPEAAAARGAPTSVHQSLFSAIRVAGYDGSAASSIAWRLIKACRPKMSESASSRAMLDRVPVEELTELAGCVDACAGRASMAEPARSDLLGDIRAMLDGYISRPRLAIATPAAPTPKAAHSAFQLRQFAKDARLLARANELIAAGVEESEAFATAHKENPEPLREPGDDE